jgi:hypothetical protein
LILKFTISLSPNQHTPFTIPNPPQQHPPNTTRTHKVAMAPPKKRINTNKRAL